MNIFTIQIQRKERTGHSTGFASWQLEDSLANIVALMANVYMYNLITFPLGFSHLLYLWSLHFLFIFAHYFPKSNIHSRFAGISSSTPHTLPPFLNYSSTIIPFSTDHCGAFLKFVLQWGTLRRINILLEPQFLNLTGSLHFGKCAES